MSLTRTAFRLALIEAFRADPVIDAQCGDRVFDSRIGEIDSAEPVPMITVLTEDDGGKAWSENNGGPPFDGRCELLVEIAMRGTVPAEGTAPAMIGTAETDGALEAIIDLLETRAIWAATWAPTPQSALVRAVAKRVLEFKSTRFTSVETGAKLAVRMVHLGAQLKDFGPDDPRSPPTGPFATLPEPLRTVAAAMPAGSSGLLTCQMLAAAMTGTATPTAPLLTGADMIVAPIATLDPANPPTMPAPDAIGPLHGNFGVTATPPTT